MCNRNFSRTLLIVVVPWFIYKAVIRFCCEKHKLLEILYLQWISGVVYLLKYKFM